MYNITKRLKEIFYYYKENFFQKQHSEYILALFLLEYIKKLLTQ